MISRYFLCLTEMRLRFANMYSYVPLRGGNKYKKKLFAICLNALVLIILIIICVDRRSVSAGNLPDMQFARMLE